MEKVIRIFHYLSFTKYPIILIGLYYCYRPILFDNSSFFQDINVGLIFIGLGIGLDSLKDSGKLNWLDKKVFYKPKIAKFYFIIFGLMILIIIFIGIKNYLSADDNKLKELSIGFIVIGIGLIGSLKSGIETTKNYMNKEKIKTTGNRVDG
ncbi:MAG: hypothetical protein AAFO07_09835 [Bacteroidota bacterium]